VQSFPHDPQFCGSVWVSVQPRPQESGVGAAQVHPFPLRHDWPAAHETQATPPPPQEAVDWRVTHPIASQHPFGQELALQATQVPFEHTCPGPHGLPSAWGSATCWSSQRELPLVQLVTPLSQTLVEGKQVTPGVHAPQLPFVQNIPGPQEVPLSALPVGRQTGTPELQSIVFVTQRRAGSEQSAPALQAPASCRGIVTSAAPAFASATSSVVASSWTTTMMTGLPSSPASDFAAVGGPAVEKGSLPQ